MLRHRALERKWDERGKQKRRDIEGLARRQTKLEKELEAVKKRIARVGADVLGDSQSTMRGSAVVRSGCGSGRRPKAYGSTEIGCHTRREKT